MRVKYIATYLENCIHALVFHAISCITCSSASRCLRDSGSPVADLAVQSVLATSVELVQAETVFFFEN